MTDRASAPGRASGEPLAWTVDDVKAEIEKPGYSLIRAWLAIHGGASAQIVLEEMSQLARTAAALSSPSVATQVFIAAIRTLREYSRVEAACTAGHPNYRERQYSFMLKLDEALQIIDTSAPSPSAAANKET